MYKIIFSQQADRFIGKLEGIERERIIKSLERIRIRPERFLEKLVGQSGYKFRVGKYRLFIDLDKGDLLILVLEIGHRKNIYDR